MGEVTVDLVDHRPSPFNGPVEIGLRSLILLTEGFPEAYSLQRLVISDYLLVHSDDVVGGPPGLHPQTPHRGSELLVRRAALEPGLLLYGSRGLIERQFQGDGLFFAATERAGAFLDALESDYIAGVKDRAAWVVRSFGRLSDDELGAMVSDALGAWGAEFSMESVLWAEDPQ